MYTSLLQDPVALKERLFEDLRNNGVTLDPTGSPASMLLESTVMTVSSALQSIGIGNKKKFSSLADSFEDIYYHLYGEKIKDVFSSPGSAKFNLLYSRNELKSLAVPVAGQRYSKLIIPAYTYYVANDKEYTLLRPIDILFYENGSTRIVYDSNMDNPVQPLESNQVPWFVTNMGGVEALVLEVELLQVKRRMITETIQLGKTFKQSLSLDGKFHYCRVFDGASGSEYGVSFNEELKDPTRPTAIVRYLNDKLEVVIPSFYSNQRMVSRTVDIEVYVTSGQIDDPIDLLKEGSIGTTYGDGIVRDSDSIYSAPLSSVGMHSVVATTSGRGGHNGMTLDQVLTHIKYSGDDATISFDALESSLNFRDFRLSLIEEDILKRTFLATKELPANVEDSFSTGISAAIDRVKLTLGDLSNVSTVIDNDQSITIMPGTLFKYVNGIPELVHDRDAPHVKSNSSAVDLANEVNSSSYAYVPIHYVLDSKYDRLTMEPYYLKDPKVKSRNFVAENLSLDYSIKTVDVSIEPTDSGYKLKITSSFNEALKGNLDKIKLLAKFRPDGEKKDAARIANLVAIEGKYVMWEVDINTNYEITREHKLNINNFVVHDDTEDDFKCSLVDDFKLIYVMSRESMLGYVPTSIDSEIPTNYIGKKFVGLTHEKVRLHLGRHLKKLWSNSRTLPGPWDWELHEVDVPLTYPKDIYEMENGKYVTEVVDGRTVPKIKHRAGDQVYIDGEPQYLYEKGSVVKDENGEPKVRSPHRGSERVLELLLVDGVYRYANSAVDLNYSKSIPKLIVDIIDLELDDRFSNIGENTEFNFSPKKTLGDIPVMVDSGTRMNIPANLGFEIDVYMTGEKKQDSELVNNIKNQIPGIITEVLKSDTIDVKSIQSSIKEYFSGDIEAVDLKIKGLETVKVISPINQEHSPSIKRKLSVLRDNQLIVENDILFNPIAHKTIIS